MPALREQCPGPWHVAYLSNLYPCAVEPYVGEEIDELRRQGVEVTPCSVWKKSASGDPGGSAPLTVVTLQPWSWLPVLALCLRHSAELREISRDLVARGPESWLQRLRGVFHTLLGARLALLLRGRNVRHIHVHHGYLAAWIGMVAARLLRISYSLTLHGSDLLVRPVFLEAKLEHCSFCITVSEFNRNHILRQYPRIAAEKIVVQRIGIPIPFPRHRYFPERDPARTFQLLAVGRLHPVKDHAFLIQACAALRASGHRVQCRVAGEGPEHARLEDMARGLGVQDEIEFLGHVPRADLTAIYCDADLVVLTSRSEGIPLALMEAMALGCLVLAPAITGIPELIVHGETGFLYQPGSLRDFVEHVEFIRATCSAHEAVRSAARAHVQRHFDRESNLRHFSDTFMERISGERKGAYADSLLQQV